MGRGSFIHLTVWPGRRPPGPGPRICRIVEYKPVQHVVGAHDRENGRHDHACDKTCDRSPAEFLRHAPSSRSAAFSQPCWRGNGPARRWQTNANISVPAQEQILIIGVAFRLRCIHVPAQDGSTSPHFTAAKAASDLPPAPCRRLNLPAQPREQDLNHMWPGDWTLVVEAASMSQAQELYERAQLFDERAEKAADPISSSALSLPKFVAH